MPLLIRFLLVLHIVKKLVGSQVFFTYTVLLYLVELSLFFSVIRAANVGPRAVLIDPIHCQAGHSTR